MTTRNPFNSKSSLLQENKKILFFLEFFETNKPTSFGSLHFTDVVATTGSE